jgi:HSP20 family molecular chaperone IbpA
LADDYDDYNDMMDEIRKFFELNSGLFDIDFFIFPESDKELNSKNKKQKGFKVSYHFENGMDKPEIKVEGDIDEKKFREYLKKYNLKEDSRVKIMPATVNNNKLLDAKELSLEPCENDHSSCIIDPVTEIYDYKEYIEMVMEVPGINKDDITLDVNGDAKKIKFSARIRNREYIKELIIPFKFLLQDYTLDVNNGIATLRVWRNKLNTQ